VKPLTPEEIRLAVKGTWLATPPDVMIEGVSTDTRTAGPGDLFVAIRGERFDGHDFLPQAAEAGCIAAVVERDRPVGPEVARLFGCGVLAVDDTTEALGRLGAYHRHVTAATAIGVTGSNGKTTVKRMLHHVLRTRLRGTCSPKSFNNAIGVPLTLLGATPGDDYVVCEVGSSAPGEVAALARLVRPQVGVVTSVGEAHLAGLGSLEQVAAEKASILGELADGGLGVVWADSEALDRAARAHDVRQVRFGESESADVRLTGYKPTETGCRLEINGRLRADLPVGGRHNAVNALAAIAAAQRLGFEREEAATVLASYEPADMRTQRIDAGAIVVINDAYNANPASMLAAARLLAETDARRRVFIAGDMRELGADEVALHERTGRELATTGLDLLIGVGKLGRYIAGAAADAGTPAEMFDSVDEAAAVTALLRAGDTVLVKGSRAMRMERLIEPILAAFAPDEADRTPMR
jgi:UDP-N-acetylmuramoyl-tripeptide--D-alanyl-D-alanine ligase